MSSSGAPDFGSATLESTKKYVLYTREVEWILGTFLEKIVLVDNLLSNYSN